MKEKQLTFQGKTYMVLGDVSDGARTKIWVQYGTDKFLYKENKKFPSGEWTYENVSEYLAKLIGDVIQIPCVSITLLDHAILSKVESKECLQSFIEYSEELQHSFHMSNLSTYDISTLLDRNSNAYFVEVVQMLLFDILIGNSDRHPGNYMYSEKEGFYPLFDNGSSLCSYVEEEKIKFFLCDKLRFDALIKSKSRPVLRAEQKLTHYELLQILKQFASVEVMTFCDKLINLDVESVVCVLPISPDRKKLLIKFLTERKNWFYE